MMKSRVAAITAITVSFLGYQVAAPDRINPAQKMTFRKAPFEIEEIKQLALIDRLPTHHHPAPLLNTSSRGIMIRR
jgi:hypothetical protein